MIFALLASHTMKQFGVTSAVGRQTAAGGHELGQSENCFLSDLYGDLFLHLFAGTVGLVSSRPQSSSAWSVARREDFDVNQ